MEDPFRAAAGHLLDGRWRECGPLDEALHLTLDYDLFCRFSRRYRFHFLDEVLATYRLHNSSKTCSTDPDEVLELATEVSRRYWGSPLLPKYWLLRASLAWHRFARENNPSARAGNYPPRGLRLRRRAWLVLAHLLAPRAALRPCLPRWLLPLWDRLCERRTRVGNLWQRRATHSETLSFRSFTGLHPDNSVGPVHETEFVCAPGQDALRLEAEEIVRPMPGPFEIELRVDGRTVCRHRHRPGQAVALTVPLPDLEPGRHRLTLRCSTAVVLHDWTWAEDYRPLSLRLLRLEPITSAAARSRGRGFAGRGDGCYSAFSGSGRSTPAACGTPAMADATADHNLLLGVLALRNELLSRDALLTGLDAWFSARGKPLGQILVEQQALTAAQRTMLDGLVRDRLRQQQEADEQADPHATKPYEGPPPVPVRYHILALHRSGGMGEVFVAHDEELGRKVALKQIRNEYADHPDFRAASGLRPRSPAAWNTPASRRLRPGRLRGRPALLRHAFLQGRQPARGPPAFP